VVDDPNYCIGDAPTDGRLESLMSLLDGTLVQGEGQLQQWVICRGARFRASSPEALHQVGIDDKSVRILPPQELAAIPTVPPDGTVIQDRADGRAYIVQYGVRLWIPNPEAFDAAGLTWKSVRVLPAGSVRDLPYVGKYPPAWPMLLRSRIGRRALSWTHRDQTRRFLGWLGNQVLAFLLGVAAGVVATLLIARR